MKKVMVAGAGTDVGKTVVSAVLTTALRCDYWKPIQCGDEIHSDTNVMKTLIDTRDHFIHPPVYSLRTPVSPHHAARLESVQIDCDNIVLPKNTRSLVIEGVGGIFVPLTDKILTIDVFKSWDCHWVVVSRHYVGSINHTLLTIDALKQHQIHIAGIIFNGEANPDSEDIIMNMTQLPCLGRLFPESELNPQTIQRYAKQWYPQLSKVL